MVNKLNSIVWNDVRKKEIIKQVQYSDVSLLLNYHLETPSNAMSPSFSSFSLNYEWSFISFIRKSIFVF